MPQLPLSVVLGELRVRLLPEDLDALHRAFGVRLPSFDAVGIDYCRLSTFLVGPSVTSHAVLDRIQREEARRKETGRGAAAGAAAAAVSNVLSSADGVGPSLAHADSSFDAAVAFYSGGGAAGRLASSQPALTAADMRGLDHRTALFTEELPPSTVGGWLRTVRPLVSCESPVHPCARLHVVSRVGVKHRECVA